MGTSQDFAVGKRWLEGGLLRDEVRLMQRTLPASWGRQLQPERGFLGIGDGDEELGLSKHFEQDRIFGYTPEQVFDVVAAVDLYEDFVPWCQKSRILWRTEDKMDAELEIGFKLFLERYISHVELKSPNLIKTTVSQSSLFDFLDNEWHFKPGPTPDSCHLFLWSISGSNHHFIERWQTCFLMKCKLSLSGRSTNDVKLSMVPAWRP